MLLGLPGLFLSFLGVVEHRGWLYIPAGGLVGASYFTQLLVVHRAGQATTQGNKQAEN